MLEELHDWTLREEIYNLLTAGGTRSKPNWMTLLTGMGFMNTVVAPLMDHKQLHLALLLYEIRYYMMMMMTMMIY